MGAPPAQKYSTVRRRNQSWLSLIIDRIFRLVHDLLMQIDLIDTFLDLCETRSFNQTAERLEITQSTVSARIKAFARGHGTDNRRFAV